MTMIKPTSFLISILILTQLLTAQDLTQQIENIYKASDISGLAVAVFTKDSVIYKNAFGYADVSAQKPFTLNTTINIGSTSKTLIAVALMKLYEEGKINLDADINDYLPYAVRNPRHPDIPITIRQLSTHTSSIRDRYSNYELKAYYLIDQSRYSKKGMPLTSRIHFKRMSKNKKIDLGKYLKDYLSTEGKYYKKKSFHKSKPGVEENYSNLGAALAAYVIEEITDIPYGDYVKNEILKPLGMSLSGWSIDSDNQKYFAKRYVNKSVVPNYGLITYPDGGLISSTDDMINYSMSMIGGYFGEQSILSRSSFDLMMSNQYDVSPLSATSTTTSQRGIFWDIFGTSDDGDIGHTGSDPGIETFMYFDPTSGVGCLLMSNCSGKKQTRTLIEVWKLLIAYRNGLN